MTNLICTGLKGNYRDESHPELGLWEDIGDGYTYETDDSFLLIVKGLDPCEIEITNNTDDDKFIKYLDQFFSSVKIAR